MIRLGLLGAKGRMGQQVKALLGTPEFSAQAQITAEPGRGASWDALLSTDAVIDFALPEALAHAIPTLLSRPGRLPAFVVGSTGWSSEQKTQLEALARKTPVLQASNFSLGVQFLAKLLEREAPRLQALGYRASMTEVHHIHKKDAPSGTALSLRHAALGPQAPAHGTANDPLPIESLRQGEVIGDHAVRFTGPADWLEFRHFATDRSLFARGAVEVALWLTQRKAPSPDISGQPRNPILGLEAFLQEKLPI
jgi:4-hydroxy-tetrahydrodipicolinate reductase